MKTAALDFAVKYDMIYAIELGTPLACPEETGGLIGEFRQGSRFRLNHGDNKSSQEIPFRAAAELSSNDQLAGV
jgi:hypothetical protein